MKDIDFDELDKAVSSLMGSMSDAPSTPKSDDVKVLSLPGKDIDQPVKLNDTLPVSAPIAVNVPQKDISTPAKTDTVVANEEPIKRELSSPPPRPLATRRSGRFMDVVHPSSDMKTTAATSTATANSPLSRLGASLTPLNPTVENKNDETLTETRGAERSTAPTEATVNEDKTLAPDSAWPDPIDFHNALHSDKQDESSDSDELAVKDEASEDEGLTLNELVEPDKDGTTTEGTSKPLSQESELDDEPVQSPFLPNVSPEKRPLGGFTPQSANQVSSGIADAEDVAEPKDTLSLDPKKNDDKTDTVERISLPEELSENVLAVESTDAAAHDTSLDKSDDKDEKKSSSATHDDSPAPGQFAGGSSIAPQYKTTKSTGDTHHEALYDSAAISPTVKHAAKKKSGWLGVVIILVLILVGVGGAAALYFFDLI